MAVRELDGRFAETLVFAFEHQRAPAVGLRSTRNDPEHQEPL